MNKNRKYLSWLLAIVAVVAVAAAVTFVVVRSGDSPDGVTTGGTTLAPVPTETTTTPSTSTTTAVPPPVTLPTETLKSLNPQPVCAPDEVNSACWNTEPDTGGVPLPPEKVGEVFDVLPSNVPGTNYDKVVFKVGTTEQEQFSVRYVDQVQRQGSGSPVDVRGGAVLELTISGPSNTTVFNGFDFQGSAANYAALREIKYAGTFEGQTTFAIGVDHKVPFAVMYGDVNPNAGSIDVVLYVAHE